MTDARSAIEVVVAESGAKGKRLIVAWQEDGSVGIEIIGSDESSLAVVTIDGPAWARFIGVLAQMVEP